MDDLQLPKRKPGRPRVPAHLQGCGVTTWLAASEYDKLIRIANAHDLSVSALVRKVVQWKLRVPK